MSNALLIRQFYSFSCFPLLFFHYKQGAFFNIKFHSYIMAIIISLFASFSHHFYLVVFHWSLNDCTSPWFWDSSKYSSWSQQCCGLYGLDSSSNFQFLQSLSQVYGDQLKLVSPSCSTNFSTLWLYPLYVYHFTLFHFHYVVCWDSKIHLVASSFFLLINVKFGLLALLDDLFISPNSRELYGFHFLGCILICAYTIY